MPRRNIFGFAATIVVIVLSLGYLAYTGVEESKDYYVTISELRRDMQQGDAVYKKRLRVAGNVAPGSIRRRGAGVEFTLVEEKVTLPVLYTGTEPPPDTFKDDAQALAMGQMGRDGVFHANGIQAKCASKYAPKPGETKPAAAPAPAVKSGT